MKAELGEIGGIARGASERAIETEVVHVLKRAGWPRAQINQDVPISDKGVNKADIVLRLDGQPVILVEVKIRPFAGCGQLGQSLLPPGAMPRSLLRNLHLSDPSAQLSKISDSCKWQYSG